jgi:predicted phage replisome organizer
MADVKWIKLTTDMFDNRKIKHLRRLPEGNNIVLIWVMLLTMAGRCNSGGMIFLTENIPYTPKMLADELDFEENTVQLALKALEQLNMVVTDQGYFTIAGWDEYQNIEGMDKIREQNRIRQQKRREKTKQALIGSGNTCEYCGKEGTTVDHVIPKTKGGLDVPENTVCSCLACNMRKTNRNIDVFLNELIATDGAFDVSRILSNSKIMQFVVYDGKNFLSRDITLQVTASHATEEDIEEELEEEKELDKEKKRKKKDFTPPTLEEIEDYCKSRNNNVDAKRFFDFFDASNWVDSKGNKVRNWKQKVITWESYNKEVKQDGQATGDSNKVRFGNII